MPSHFTIMLKCVIVAQLIRKCIEMIIACREADISRDLVHSE